MLPCTPIFRPLLLVFALPLFAQQKLFAAATKIGVPCVVGHETWIDPTTKIETGTLREITLQSAELALTFPNRHEKVVSHDDPETLKQIWVELKPGASAPFIGVWRISADLTDYRFGLTCQRPVKVACYDLGPVLGKLPSANPNEVEGLELRVEGGSEPGVFAGEASDPSKHRYVVTATVTNRLLLPVRWGWHYMTTELLDAAGRAVKAHPDIIDRATMRSWSGDLNAGASMQAAFVFYSPTPVTPRALRLSFNASGRTVEAALTR